MQGVLVNVTNLKDLYHVD